MQFRKRNLHRKLGLDGNDLGILDGLVDGLGAHFGQRNAPDLARLHIFLVDDAKGDLEGDVRVAAPELEHVDLLAALELGDAVVQGAAGVLRRGIELVGLGINAALDAKDNLVGILGVFFKVTFEQDETVVVGGAVKLGPVPAVAFRCQCWRCTARTVYQERPETYNR